MAVAFICLGWMIILCLHEFGHAIVAYVGGDKSVKEKGYLTLNPLRYTDVNLSLVVPLVFLLLGGIALPGAAVFIDHNQLKNRFWESAVAAAGPIFTVLCVLGLALPFWLNMPLDSVEWLAPSLAYLVLLAIVGAILNSLPVPPLDGFGVIEPWLPEEVQMRVRQLSGVGPFIIFGILWFVQPANDLLWRTAYQVLKSLDISPVLAAQGYRLFKSQSMWLILVIVAMLFFLRQKKS